jgi:hypothetical protein
MGKRAKAHAFSVIPRSGTPEEIVALLRKFVRNKVRIEFSCDTGSYSAGDAHFVGRPGQEVFTATIYRLRGTGLPSVIDGTNASPLQLPSGSNLGEPMSFAYDPHREAAVAEQANYGPRATVIRTFLEEIDFQSYVDIKPKIRENMLDRLRVTRVFRTMDYSVKHSPDSAALWAAGEPFKAASDAMDSISALRAHVVLSMGNTPGSLDAQAVKDCVLNVLREKDTNLTSLKLRVEDEETGSLAILDMLGGRVEYDIELKESGREWDREDCRRQLADYLREHGPGENTRPKPTKRRTGQRPS